MGYQVFTSFAIFKTSLSERKRLEQWISDEELEMMYGIGEWCKWRYETDDEIKAMSEEFPLIMFVFANFGEEDCDYRYVTVHNGLFTSFEFFPSREDQVLLDEISSRIDELEEDDEYDLLCNEKDRIRQYVVEQKIQSMYLDNLSFLFYQEVEFSDEEKKDDTL